MKKVILFKEKDQVITSYELCWASLISETAITKWMKTEILQVSNTYILFPEKEKIWPQLCEVMHPDIWL